MLNSTMCRSKERLCFFSATRIEFARETRKDINRRAEFIYERKILDRSKQHTPSRSPRRVVGRGGWEGERPPALFFADRCAARR